MAVARAFTSYAGPYFEQFDSLATKKCPERMIGDEHTKVVFFSDTLKIFAKACGKHVEQYKRDCDVTTKLHLIKKPFFFISTIDDPFFGQKVIPIGHCHDNILLGVLKHGGHCCNIEGGILPTGQWWTKPSMVFMDHFMREAL
jgi:predicted alpha/beta-fold hydrolase